MFFNAKKILPVLLCLTAASCSSHKDLPQGKRISIMDTPSLADVSAIKKADIHLSSPVDILVWSQTGSNAAHLNQNISVSKDAETLFTFDFGKGSSKGNLLMAAPVVANDIVYIQNVQGTVSAFNLKDGKKLFSRKLPSLNKNDFASGSNGVGLAVDGTRLYALAGFGGVFALDASSGEIIWRYDLNLPIRTAPTIADNLLFVQTINNQLFCLNAKDGTEMWRYNISAEDTVLAGGATPAFDKTTDTVISAFSNGELQAFNAKIGYPVWSQDLINTTLLPSPIHAVKASPVIDNKIVYAVGSNAQTMAVNIETGDIIWQAPLGGTSSPLVDKEVLFMVSSDYELLALDKKSGDIFWRSPVLGETDLKHRRNIYIFAPLLLNDSIFVAASNGMIMRYDAKTGVLQSEDYIGQNIAVQPIAADGSLILTTENAKLIIYR